MIKGKSSTGLSVVLPAQNEVRNISTAISDLKSSLLENDEILVIDDGSEDGTSQILLKLCAEDSRIRSIRTSGIGLVKALKLGLQEASHDWIARADADDRYPPDRLKIQRDAIQDETVGIVGDYKIISESADMGYMACALGSKFVGLSLIHPQRIPHPGIMVNRQAILEAGNYRESEFPSEDLGLWMRLSNIGDIIGIPRPTVAWKLSKLSTSHSRQKEQRLMTRRLIEGHNFPLWKGLTGVDVAQEIHAYVGTPQETQRLLLLVRDMTSLAHRFGKTSLLKPVVQALAKHPLSASGAVANLTRDKHKRDKWRQSP